MMHKATQMMLAIVLALSSGLSAAEATHHKRSRHVATRPVKTPASTSEMRLRKPCPIPGMGTANEVGTDNDVNVYRDRPEC